ncbi:carboxylate--amine ligase [Mycobacteroides chelonae CCUG 47445]|nr:carboxylate--amine ligase [Mycobacteroides chelonae CCUG 47445]
MPIRLLVVGGGSELQPRLRRIAHNVETAVLCRASVLPWVHELGENRAVIVLNDELPVAQWIDAAKALRELWPFDNVVSFAEIDQDRAAMIAYSLGIPFHAAETITCAHDKLALRERLREAGVEDVPHVLIPDEAALYRAVEELGLPLIVKPQRGRASAGIAVVESLDDVPGAFTRAADARAPRLQPSPVLAERFIIGREYSVESLSHRGRHFVLAITGKHTDPKSKVELGHVVPAIIDGATEKAILAHTRAALTAIGVESGITHTEVIVSVDGPIIIETHLRLAGDDIPLLVQDATGIDMTELLLRQLVGEDIAAIPELRARVERPQYRSAAGIRYLVPLEDGELVGVEGWDAIEGLDGVVSVENAAEVSTQMKGLESSYSRLGHVRAQGAHSPAVEQTLDKAVASLKVLTR